MAHGSNQPQRPLRNAKGFVFALGEEIKNNKDECGCLVEIGERERKVNMVFCREKRRKKVDRGMVEHTPQMNL